MTRSRDRGLISPLANALEQAICHTGNSARGNGEDEPVSENLSLVSNAGNGEGGR